MIKRLTRHGNSLALVIDRPILDMLGIDANTLLEISTDGECLIISPVRDPGHQERFERVLDKVNRKYGRALKRLAE